MTIQNDRKLEEIGEKIAIFYNAAIKFEKSGFTLEKNDNDSNTYRFTVEKRDKDTYFRINFVYSFINEQSNVIFERGILSDKKPYMREVIRDVKNLYLTIPESTDIDSKNIITFLYTHGDRFSIVNVDTDMKLSRMCAFDRRKFQQDKKVPKEILGKRREFEKV